MYVHVYTISTLNRCTVSLWSTVSDWQRRQLPVPSPTRPASLSPSSHLPSQHFLLEDHTPSEDHAPSENLSSQTAENVSQSEPAPVYLRSGLSRLNTCTCVYKLAIVCVGSCTCSSPCILLLLCYAPDFLCIHVHVHVYHYNWASGSEPTYIVVHIEHAQYHPVQ